MVGEALTPGPLPRGEPPEVQEPSGFLASEALQSSGTDVVTTASLAATPETDQLDRIRLTDNHYQFPSQLRFWVNSVKLGRTVREPSLAATLDSSTVICLSY